MESNLVTAIESSGIALPDAIGQKLPMKDVG